MKIVLVACCGRKLKSAAPAKDLYTSNLFRLSRQYAERECTAWLILSAKYGVVEPEQIIEPYDVSLSGLSRQERTDWADFARSRLHYRYPHGSGHFVVLAGSQYREAVRGLVHSVPMRGLGIGQQMAWLKRHLEESVGSE